MKKIKVLFIMFTVMLDQLELDMLMVDHKDGHQEVVALLILMLVHMMKHKTWHTKDTSNMNKLFAILQKNISIPSI
jgi:ribosomal protein S15P/S13E